MRDQQVIGKWGEQLATEYLISQGLSIIETNFLCKAGEIDIIANENGVLVFVEVRVRNTIVYGSALESITTSKQRKVRKSAEWYLQKIKYQGDCRIDAIGIDTSKEPIQIEWIKNAF